MLLYRTIQVVSRHHKRRVLLFKLQSSLVVRYLAHESHIVQVNIAAITSLRAAHIHGAFLLSTLEHALLTAHILAVGKLVLRL